eukprot:gene6634-8206_t
MFIQNDNIFQTYKDLTIQWDYTIIDEAQRINKNNNSINQSLNNLSTRLRISMTGTPVQNNLNELYNILKWTCPHLNLLDVIKFNKTVGRSINDSYYTDTSNVVKINGRNDIIDFKSKINGNILRREKSLLKEQNLFNCRKNDLVLWVKLSKIQYDISKQYQSNQWILESINPKGHLISYQSGFQKIVSHLKLSLRDDTKSDPIKNIFLLKGSNKLNVLYHLVNELFKEGGHKVIVFSQWTQVLDIIEDLFSKMKLFKFSRMDGSTIDRSSVLRKFNTSSTQFCLLVSTSSGSVGLNLTSADRVILYDPSWGIIDEQAVDRVYRIGQQNNVVIYRLITSGTIEEWKYRRQIFKGSLSKTMMNDSNHQNRFFKPGQLDDIENISDNRYESETRNLLIQYFSEKNIQRNSDKKFDQHLNWLNSLGFHDHDLVNIQVSLEENEDSDCSNGDRTHDLFLTREAQYHYAMEKLIDFKEPILCDFTVSFTYTWTLRNKIAHGEPPLISIDTDFKVNLSVQRYNLEIPTETPP